MKVDDLLQTMVSDAGIATRAAALGVLGGIIVTIALFILANGIKLIKIALLTAAAGETVTAIGLSITASAVLGCIASALGIILVALGVALVIATVVIAFTW